MEDPKSTPSLRSQDVKRLLHWYARHHRALPWRNRPTPYQVLVSEFLLQQTRTEQAIPHYARFLKKFPTLADLARARQSAVLKAWEGLGYYARARHLHQTAKHIFKCHNGRIPRDEKTLQTLPGIGSYTAAAVASIAFSRACAVVDGNVLRVMARFQALEKDISKPLTRAALKAQLEQSLPQDAGAFNQALMELGATLCTPKTPSCTVCPLKNACVAFATRTQSRYPLKPKRKKTPTKHFGAIYSTKDNRVLMVQRPPAGLLAGMWELPTVPFSPLEDSPSTLSKRFEEQGVQVNIKQEIAQVRHAYTHFRQVLHVFSASSPRGSHLTWLSPSQQRQRPVPRVQQKALVAVKAGRAR